MISITITAENVAWYGAIIATLSMLISLFLFLRDQASIKIVFRKDIRLHGTGSYDTSKKYLNITVVNTGRRPINISKVGVRVASRGNEIFSDSFASNHVLTEANPRAEFLAQQQLINYRDIVYAWVEDGTGKLYKKNINYIGYLKIIWLKIGNFISRK